jgi:hypothetical protein
VSNIQTPDTGGKKPGPQDEQGKDDRKQSQGQPDNVQTDDDLNDQDDDEKLIDKEAPGQQQQQQKKKLDQDDGGMDTGTLGERPTTEETELEDDADDAKH